MKSPTSSAASTTNSPASTANSPMASPASAKLSPMASMVPSTPCSAMDSPNTTPPTAKAPAPATAAVPAATLAPVLQPELFWLAAAPEVFASPVAVIAASAGTGTNIACPAFALRGTLTAMYAPFTPGCGTWMVVPGDPAGTVMTVVGPSRTNGLEGAFQL